MISVKLAEEVPSQAWILSAVRLGNALTGGPGDGWELGLELLMKLFSILPGLPLGDGAQQLARSLKNCRQRFKQKDRLSQRMEVLADASVRICRLETAWRHLLEVTVR
jgi:hypothetical protein